MLSLENQFLLRVSILIKSKYSKETNFQPKLNLENEKIGKVFKNIN